MKNKHLLLVNRGTNYFHSLVKERNFASTIPSLIKVDGNCTTSQEEVFKEFVDYYNDLLGIKHFVEEISNEILQQGPFYQMKI